MAVNGSTRTQTPEFDSSPPFADSWSRKHSTTIKCAHKWTIDNLSFLIIEPTLSIKSSLFSPEANDKLTWHLQLYMAVDANKKHYFVVCLHLNSCDKSGARTKCTMSVVNAQNVKTNSQTKFQSFMMTYPNSHSFSLPITKADVLQVNKVNELLPDGKLTIFCELEILGELRETSGKSNTIVRPKLPEQSHMLGDHGGLFLESQKFSDITFTINGKDIRAHKMMLAAHSPVFSAMFDHDMKEKKENCVKINDTDYEMFMEMLRFIYTGKTTNLEEMAAGLLVLADKYALDTLKVMCEEALLKNLNIESAADTLIVAYLHNAAQLKIQVMTFIFSRMDVLAETEAFKKMVKSHPELAVEFIRAMSLKFSNKPISFDTQEKRSK